MLKKLLMLAGALALTLLVGRPAAADITLTFTSDPSGISLVGSGTAAATMAFGNVQAFGGTLPIGVTKSVNGSANWSLSTFFDVTVTTTSGGTPNYTMTAQLQTADAANTWKVGSITVTAAPVVTITATGAYGLTVYSFSLTIPFSGAPGAINNTINITVTNN